MPPEFALTPAMPEEQLLLPLQGRSDITLADLPARAFAPVLSALAQLRAGQLGEVCIWGAPGAGRSLLLSAFVSDVARDAGQAVLLPLRQVVFMPPEMLDGLESCPLIVLDDIEAVAEFALRHRRRNPSAQNHSQPPATQASANQPSRPDEGQGQWGELPAQALPTGARREVPSWPKKP